MNKPAEGNEEGNEVKPPENIIPKETHEAAIKEKEQALGTLKRELDNAKLQLLDPDYIEYVNNKRKGKTPDTPASKPPEGTADNPELAELQRQIKELKETVNAQNANVGDFLVRQELEATMSKYTDFSEYRDDVGKILESNGALTYEQAYHLAKSYRKDAEETKPAKPPATPPKGSEKPNAGAPSGSVTEPKEFKSVEDANKATVAALREKYEGLGDTI